MSVTVFVMGIVAFIRGKSIAVEALPRDILPYAVHASAREQICRIPCTTISVRGTTRERSYKRGLSAREREEVRALFQRRADMQMAHR